MRKNHENPKKHQIQNGLCNFFCKKKTKCRKKIKKKRSKD